MARRQRSRRQSNTNAQMESSSDQEIVSNKIGENQLSEQLQKFIMNCFENFESKQISCKHLSVTDKNLKFEKDGVENTDSGSSALAHVNAVNSSISKEPMRDESQVSFLEFYDLVYRSTGYNQDRTNPYRVYRKCAAMWFNQFAELLSKRISNCAQNQSENNNKDLSASHESPALLLVHFWKNIFENVLIYIGSVFMYLERINLKSSKKMLIYELTSSLFAQLVIESQPLIRKYVEQVVLSYINSKQRQFQQYLIHQVTQSDKIDLEVINLDNVNHQQHAACVDLIRMLIMLDSQNLIYFYKIIEIPVIEANYRFATQMSAESIRTLPMSKYVQLASNFIQLSYQVWAQLGFPVHTRFHLNKFLCHSLFSERMSDIIYNPTSGFMTYLNSSSYSVMAEMYQTVESFYNYTLQAPLFDQFIICIERHLDQVLRDTTARFDCRNRAQSIEFVRHLFALRTQWDTVLTIVFRNQLNFDQVVNKFYFHLLKFNDRIPQALAYFGHDLCHRNSSILANLAEFADFQSDFDHQMKLISKRNQLLSSLIALIPFIKDVNFFFDYIKHYFSLRILTKTSSLTLANEFEYLDQMVLVIKTNFYDDNASAHKQFTQNPNDFRMIINDYNNSADYFQNTFLPSVVFSAFIDSFQILHAGIWKLIDFDQCWLPEKIVTSFRFFELYYQLRYKRKKLLLNTKFSKATLTVYLSDSQPKPLTLVTTLHQLAILSMFNDQDQLNYEAIFQQTKFQKESNLQLALLSLVYTGLVRCLLPNPASSTSSSSEDLKFQLNTRFYEIAEKSSNLKEETADSIYMDISYFEEINFWNFGRVKQNSNEENEYFSLVTKELSNGEDLFFANTTLAVEDINANILQRPSVQTSRDMSSSTDQLNSSATQQQQPPRKSSLLASRESRRMSETLSCEASKSNSLSTHQLSSVSDLRRERSLSSSRNMRNLGGAYHTSREASTNNSIDRIIKLEATIVRVLKRAKHLPNMSTVYTKVKETLRNSPNAYLNSMLVELNFEEVRKALLKLVDKKYVKHSATGGFEFLVD